MGQALQGAEVGPGWDACAQLEEKEQQDLPEDLYGTFKAAPGKWGSCIRVVNPLMVRLPGLIPRPQFSPRGGRVQRRTDAAAASGRACSL